LYQPICGSRYARGHFLPTSGSIFNGFDHLPILAKLAVGVDYIYYHSSCLGGDIYFYANFWFFLSITSFRLTPATALVVDDATVIVEDITKEFSKRIWLPYQQQWLRWMPFLG
jgi:hypothetical protein